MIINKGRYEADHINENLTEGILVGVGLIIERQVIKRSLKYGNCSANSIKGIEKNKERSRDRFLRPEE